MNSQILTYNVGQKVMALWPPDDEWYRATVIRVNKKSYTVRYVDDGITKALHPRHLNPLDKVKLTETSENPPDKVNLPVTFDNPQGKVNLPENLENPQGKVNLPVTLENPQGKVNLPETSENPQGISNLPDTSENTPHKVKPSENPTDRVDVPETCQKSHDNINLPETSGNPLKRVNLPETSENPLEKANLPETYENPSHQVSLPQTSGNPKGKVNLPETSENSPHMVNLPESSENPQSKVNVPETSRNHPCKINLSETFEYSHNRINLPKTSENPLHHVNLPRTSENQRGRVNLLETSKNNPGKVNLTENSAKPPGKVNIPQNYENPPDMVNLPSTCEKSLDNIMLLETYYEKPPDKVNLSNINLSDKLFVSDETRWSSNVHLELIPTNDVPLIDISQNVIPLDDQINEQIPIENPNLSVSDEPSTPKEAIPVPFPERYQPDSSDDITKLLTRSNRSTPKTYCESSSSDNEVHTSGSEFKPSEDSYVSDSENSVSSDINPMSILRKTPSHSYGSVTSSTDDAPSKEITVMPTNNEANLRKWDKRHYCYYCSKPVFKLPRHLRMAHSDEVDVVVLINETDKEKRSNLLCKLRNLGNHKHNCEVIRKNSGQLIVAYRPKKTSANPEAYGPCTYCYGYYIRSDLWKHRCPIKPTKRPIPTDEEEIPSKRPRVKERMAAKSYLLKPASNTVANILNKVLCSMKKDTVGMIVKNDDLILEVGKREYMKLGHDEEQYSYIRTKMRELGRLLFTLRLNTCQPDAKLQQFILPNQFKTVIKAVRDVTGFDENSHVFETPSLALKLGHSIKKCSLIVKANALEKNDKETADSASNFYNICEMNWEIEISTHALRTLYQYKRNNPEILPTMSDVFNLSKYLDQTGDVYEKKLSNSSETEKKAWDFLNEIVLCQLILFNRRRQGEVSKMRVEDFKKKHFTNPGDTVILSEIEKNLCKLFEVVEVIGKRGTTVPILLSSGVTGRLQLLLEKRNQVGIPESNTYLFARSNYQSLGHIRGSDAMRKISLLADVRNPENMRTTKLRKQVATAAQMLALKENQVELLATYMGHDIRVHREYYQLPDNVLRVTKLSRLFIAMENGTLTKQQGKSLDDIEIDMSEPVDDDSDFSQDDVEEDNPANTTIASNTKKYVDGKHLKRPWSEDEKFAVSSLKYILHLRLPGKKDIEEIQRKFPVLQNRTWRNIKDYLRNNKQKILTN